ncbi:hypothetical protein [Nonomuraea jiangxiensis]|uniref:Secreted protein n=1 Tax=Nonomuraea jiangxiensis TaxID=633440 RepID=A0A1G8NKY8_9ACTN|nr:hypothetical protein [Nonomuraea jiangxiensis]SDI80863.1 hypothetical protein SAMN05421869_107154 [Nonomuraea jiangxiensis]
MPLPTTIMTTATAALLTVGALTAYAPTAYAAPAWVTDGECTDDGGEIVPVGRGKAICRGGVWDQEQIHFS